MQETLSDWPWCSTDVLVVVDSPYRQAKRRRVRWLSDQNQLIIMYQCEVELYK
jgi:hypothetical protein